MAKELPYFKFEPNKWENGNIQMLSREDKGLFIDICSMYWSRLGDLPEKLVVQKLCGGNASALRSLYEEGIIALESDRIYIDFLTVQLQEFDSLKSQNSKNAKERWRKHRQDNELSGRNASASNSQCETDAIREEEIRGDKRIEDNNIVADAPNQKKNIDDRILEFKRSLYKFTQTRGGKYPDRMVSDFFEYWSEKNKSGKKMRWENEKTFEAEKRIARWSANDKNFNQKNGKQTSSNTKFAADMARKTEIIEMLAANSRKINVDARPKPDDGVGNTEENTGYTPYVVIEENRGRGIDGGDDNRVDIGGGSSA